MEMNNYKYPHIVLCIVHSTRAVYFAADVWGLFNFLGMGTNTTHLQN